MEMFDCVQIYARRNKRYNEGGSSEEDNKPDTSLQGHRLPSSYRGTWPIRRDAWANQQMGFSTQQSTSTTVHNVSCFSFTSCARKYLFPVLTIAYEKYISLFDYGIISFFAYLHTLTTFP